MWRVDRGREGRREGLKEMGGMMREGEEVRKWMRQSYWDRGSGEGGRKRVEVMKGIDGYRGGEEGGGQNKNG